MAFSTADLCDEHSQQVRVLQPIFRDYGGTSIFWGPCSTVQTLDDNSLVRAALEEPGEGRVLVVDGGGSLQCALVGDRLGQLAMDQGWAGLVVLGCIRDAATLGKMAIGLKALNTHPRKSQKSGRGKRDVSVNVAGVLIAPGEIIYCDADGILVSPNPLHS